MKQPYGTSLLKMIAECLRKRHADDRASGDEN
jgi:hypothetical protein